MTMTFQHRLLAGLGIMFCGPCWASESPAERIAEVLKTNFPQAVIEHVQESPWPGMYEVLSNGEIVYVTADAKLLFAGRVLDIDSKRDLTQVRWDLLHPVDFDRLPFERAIKHVAGSGKRRLVVFADPDCPFCQELEKRLAGIPDVSVFTFLYPLEDIHPGATERASRIWCSGEQKRESVWLEWMRSRKEPSPAPNCDPEQLVVLNKLGRELLINSTPTLFFADGHRASILLTKEQLEEEFERAEQALNRVSANSGAGSEARP